MENLDKILDNYIVTKKDGSYDVDYIELKDVKKIINGLIDEQRENDIQKLCNGVLSASPNSWYNPNGADESTCPFCYQRVYDVEAHINEIEHSQDCVYLIAKDLQTNNK